MRYSDIKKKNPVDIRLWQIRPLKIFEPTQNSRNTKKSCTGKNNKTALAKLTPSGILQFLGEYSSDKPFEHLRQKSNSAQITHNLTIYIHTNELVNI